MLPSRLVVVSFRDGLAEVRRLRAQRKVAEAVALLEELVAKSPDEPLLAAEEVHLKLVACDAAGALRLSEELVARHPGSAACWLAVAEARRARGGPGAGVVEAATRAAELWPSALTFRTLAQAERQRGRAAEALAAVRKGLRLRPDDSPLRTLEADLLRELGFAEEAAHAAAELPEGPVKARRLLESALSRLSDAEALAELDALRELEPGRAEVHELAALRHYHGGRFAEASEGFLRSMSLEPENRYYRRMAGYALAKAGEPARAAVLLRPLFIEDPADRYVRSAFLKACEKAGDAAAARLAIDEALAAHPDAVFLHGIRRKLGGKDGGER